MMSRPPASGPRAHDRAWGRPRRPGSWFSALLVALLLVAVAPAYGAPSILDQVSTDSGTVVVQFNCPMSYVSIYPQRVGDELHVELQPLVGCPPADLIGETLPVPRGNVAGLVEVRLEQSLATRRTLILRFARTVEFAVQPRAGLTALAIALSRPAGRVSVQPAEAPPATTRLGKRTPPSPEEIQKLMAEARAAMQEHDYDRAIRVYTKLLEFPEHSERARAQEYLGLARERKGQLAQAKLEYQEYLKRYPDGADADVVRQRLAALVTLDGASKPDGTGPDASPWHVSGALAQDFRHDVNTVTANGVTANGIGESALDTEADLEVRRRGETLDVGGRVFAGYVHDFGSVANGSPSEFLVPQAYAEVVDTASHWLARVGRQSQSTGGVYGTYDGAFASWRARPGLRVGLALGSPVQLYDANLGGQRYFGNASVEFVGVLPGLDVSGFVYEARAAGIVDARQIGAEARYYANGRSVVAQVDYDIDYRVLNAATVLVTLPLPDRWVLTAIGDRRLNPFVGTFNALIGQPTTSLETLLTTLGESAVRQLARDRSATSDTLTVGLQRPVGEHLQWGNDIAYSQLGGTPASPGVAAVPAWGSAVTFSSELMGGGWFVDRDVNSVGVSYGTRAGTSTAALFASDRFPVSDHVRIGPRLQIGYTRGSDPTTGTSAGWSVSPAFMAEWRMPRGLVQLELGYQRSVINAGLAPGVPIVPTPTPTNLLDQRANRFWFSLAYNLTF